jgi:hypothetical protein
MSSRSSGSVNRPATVALCALLLSAVIAVLAAASAHAGQYKMVACAADSGISVTTQTNTVSAQHPSGIFDMTSYCGGAGGDPPGDAAFMRIAEHEPSGNAGQGAYGRIIFETPWYVHFKAAGGYTRQPNAFNDGWRSRFWGLDFASNGTIFVNQGAGLANSGTNRTSSNTFGPHLWPFTGYLDFHHFFFELYCDRPAGCDRANYNATDANGLVFILNDDSDSKVAIDNVGDPLMKGEWVRGPKGVFWKSSDLGSGMRFERVRVDGTDRFVYDNQARGMCNVSASPANGEFARIFQPCPTGGPWASSWTLDTASLTDGQHTLAVCTQDYGQFRGLNGTGSETCDSRTIRVDNHAPAAPVGLQIASPNPARYLDHFAARFSLAADSGSPISKVHYDVVNAAGAVVKPEQVLPGTNPTEITDVAAPQKAGEYRLRVWLEDQVGLTGPAALVPIPHDTTPPAAPQGVSVTSPATARTTQGFDVRWHNVTDAGSPIAAAHYQVLNGAGAIVVATRNLEADAPQAIADLETPRGRDSYTLRLWLSDAEGNVGAPVSAPLAYDCVRSDVAGGLTLSAGLGKDGAPETQLREGEAVTLGGNLKGVGGNIAGAPLCVFSNVLTDHDPQFLGIAVTGSSGAYKFALPAGPSRQISVHYRPDQRELAAEATLLTRVRPTFTLARKVVRNGGFALFHGEIPGPHNDRVVVVLQVKSGKGWRVFRRYRTREGGKFLMRYRFTQTTTPTTYVMRAQVRAQTGYPYLQGNSRALSLQVRP